MTQRGGTRIVRFGDDYSYSDIATRRMFGNPTNVEVLEDFDEFLKASSADMDVVAVVPVHNTENGNILGSGGVPLADMASSMGLRVLAKLELPVDHVLASFGRLEEIKIAYSKDVALGQCSKFRATWHEACLYRPWPVSSAQHGDGGKVCGQGSGSLYRRSLQRGGRRAPWRAHSAKGHRKLAGQQHDVSRVCQGRL